MPHTVLTIKNALVSLDGVEFGDAITKAEITVSFDTNEWVPVSGNVQSSVGALKHVLSLDFGQSFINGELLHKLYTKHGVSAPFSIRPDGVATPSVAGTLTITAPTSLVGAVGVATTTASLPINGTPTIAWKPAS